MITGHGYEPVTLDYQKILYNGSTVEVGLVYAGQCQLFCGESFSEDEVVNKSDSGASQQLLCSFNASHSQSPISIIMEAAKYTRLFVEDSEGTICSDSLSHQTFYRFLDTSK